MNISDDMDLLSYNEYIANAKVAKKKKHEIETNSLERSKYLSSSNYCIELSPLEVKN